MTTTAPAAPGSLPAQNERLLYLDGWRGLAVSLVVIGHFAPNLGVSPGPLGVELFFVLSGRLMADLLFIKKVPLRTFFPRRISRVYPALSVFVLVVAVASHFSDWPVGPKAVITALTFTFNYSVAVPWLYPHGFFNHLWSLCVEEHAYVVLALVAVLGRIGKIRPMPVILAIAGIGMINGLLSMSVFHLNYFQTYWRTDVHISSIFVAAGLWLWVDRKPSTDLPSWIAPAALTAGFVISLSSLPAAIIYSVGTTLLALGVCTLARSPLWLRNLLSNPLIVWIGVFSYSIYLWQQPFYQWHELGGLTLTAAVAATAACALASFYLVEQPARSFLNGLVAARAANRATVASEAEHLKTPN